VPVSGRVTPVAGGPKLNWGLRPAFDPDRAARVPRDLARAWQVAGDSLDLVVRPIEGPEAQRPEAQRPDAPSRSIRAALDAGRSA
jgi:hypothetical protein